jgi:hypothetical protein
MAEKIATRSKDHHMFLIEYPLKQLTGARLPSGRDVMQNFIYHHRCLKQTINDSAQNVYHQLIPFWLKSALPTRRKDHVIKKIKDLYAEQTSLMKSQCRGNKKDLDYQTQYEQKLNSLFDISHAVSDQLSRIEEDEQFLKLQQESRSGAIGSVDKKKAEQDKRVHDRKRKATERAEREKQQVTTAVELNDEIDSSLSSSAQIKLTARELASIQRFNRFVIHIYLESWFTCNSVTEAAVNDLKILERLQLYDDKELSKIGLKWLTRHSWYLSPELAALAIFSAQLSCPQKQQLIDNMITERGPHLLTNLPSTVSDLHISRALFETVGIDASFLSVPAENWCETVLHICLKNSQ